MVSFLTVNYKSDFFVKILLESIPKNWLEKNEFIIIDNSRDLVIKNKNVKVVAGKGRTHFQGLDQGLVECKNEIVIISDVDCVLLDLSLLIKLEDMIANGTAMIQCIGTQFKPFHPCFGALNKNIFLNEKLSFKSKGQISTPNDWSSFFIKHRPNKEKFVYFDVGVFAGYTLLKRGYKVEVIPRQSCPYSFSKMRFREPGWWFGYNKPQVWHIVYGASRDRFIKNRNQEVWVNKKEAAQWVLDNLVVKN